MDERDGKGREGGNNSTSNNAVVKQLFKIDLTGAVDVSGMDGLTASTHAVAKTLFLDVVSVLEIQGGFAANMIPSKIEGVAFGPDIKYGGKTVHTLWLANDNDFLETINDTPPIPNPNQFFVFGVADADLGGRFLCPRSSGASSSDVALGLLTWPPLAPSRRSPAPPPPTSEHDMESHP